MLDNAPTRSHEALSKTLPVPGLDTTFVVYGGPSPRKSCTKQILVILFGYPSEQLDNRIERNQPRIKIKASFLSTELHGHIRCWVRKGNGLNSLYTILTITSTFHPRCIYNCICNRGKIITVVTNHSLVRLVVFSIARNTFLVL